MIKRETVSIVYQHPQVLLGMKKVRFGTGMYNGFGGRIEKGEGVLESAVRETEEETGIILLDPIIKGEILFHFATDEPDHHVYFIRATRFGGIPRESEEMRPKWFSIEKIPYDRMWPDDKYWVPLLLENKFFIGEFMFDEKRGIAHHELKEVDNLRR